MPENKATNFGKNLEKHFNPISPERILKAVETGKEILTIIRNSELAKREARRLLGYLEINITDIMPDD